jgi:hypothetical protein
MAFTTQSWPSMRTTTKYFNNYSTGFCLAKQIEEPIVQDVRKHAPTSPIDFSVRPMAHCVARDRQGRMLATSENTFRNDDDRWPDWLWV